MRAAVNQLATVSAITIAMKFCVPMMARVMIAKGR
jgi:hypothetical protein